MDNTDDSENTAKVSDSAYSNSCSNSQSRRSHSSKSTHSGSNSSGSSGYGGKPSTSGFSINTQSQPSEKRSKEKDAKKKIPTQSVQTELQATEVQIETELVPVTVPSMMETSTEIIEIVARSPTPGLAQAEVAPESIDVCDRSSGKDEPSQSISPVVNPVASAPASSSPILSPNPDGFACVISMKDGVVMYATSSITRALGFPKDMWIGRSFIDFVHHRDRSTFASQISSGLAAPRNVDGTQEEALVLGDQVSTMLCRIRKYRSLNNGFGVKDKVVKFMPFALKFFFTNIKEEEKGVIYLVIQASPLFSAFKIPNEVIVNPVPFVIRHSASGKLDYIDQESVPYLGYLPQDIVDKNALQLYHISDLMYLRLVYETVVKEGGLHRSEPYRMMVQNGDYLKLETEWSSFTNPWSRKLEFVIGKHYILEGPTNPDVFQAPEPEKVTYASKEEETKAQLIREHMIQIMNEVLTKPAEVAKQQMSKRCQDLATFVESLMDDTPVPEDELRVEIQDADYSYFEHDSVLLGGISPHHDYNDSDTSTETPLSYNQLNYNENLQRYFDSHEPFNNDDKNTLAICNFAHTTDSQEFATSSSIYHSSLPNSSIESNERESNSDSSTIALVSSSSRAGTSGGYQPLRLTESRLKKHNAEMEKELLKMHRGSRSSKSEREKVSNENRQMTREHLARCNALYQPTTAGFSSECQPHGVKRASKQTEKTTTAKHRCSSPRLPRRDGGQKYANSSQMPSAGNNVPSPWPSASQANNMNGFILGLGIPQPMSAINPIAVVPGVIPMYYAPTFSHPAPPASDAPASTSHSHYHRYSNTNNPYNMNQGPMNESNLVFQINSVSSASTNAPRTNPYTMPPNQSQPPHSNHQMQCMMLGQPLYGSPFIYSAIHPQMSLTLQNSFMPQPTPITQLSGSSRPTFEESGDASSNEKRKSPLDNSDGTNDKTDGESSYSSFYSSFFKTNSSNDDSDSKNKEDNKKTSNKYRYNSSPSTSLNSFAADTTYFTKEKRGPLRKMELPSLEQYRYNNSPSTSLNSFAADRTYSTKEKRGPLRKMESPSLEQYRYNSSPSTSLNSFTADKTYSTKEKRGPLRKMEPPCLERVRVTSELMYKYQIVAKNVDEVLSSDMEKLKTLKQPALVNEQLDQLYLDLQLEGVAARLTLEEGITSSSSSGEETTPKITAARRRKREYSRLVMIYEEDAPLPPPDDGSTTF